MLFASDNTAPCHPAILEAIIAANAGTVPSYGGDDATRRVEALFAALFDHEVAVFLVPTGTAANALALSHLAPPFTGVIAHAHAHVFADELGAFAAMGQGLRPIGVEGAGGKLAPAAVEAAFEAGVWGRRQGVVPGVLSLTQATEAGTLYRPDEVAALAAIARRHGAAVHMDGARFANAVAALGVSPAAITWQAGVDVLSFGATKNGALGAEAVVFFNPARAAGFADRRQRMGHLASKHRFLAAQFEAMLAGDLWLKLAAAANAAAATLAAGLIRQGFVPVVPTEANEIFVRLPDAVAQGLRTAGARFHPWPEETMGLQPQAGAGLYRLVTSYATTAADTDAFLSTLAAGG